MKTRPCLILACLALSSSLVAAPQIIFDAPDLDETEVDEGVEELATVHVEDDVERLSEMEVNDETIQSILQNKGDKTDAPSINAPLIIRSMEDAAKHLNRASMEKLDTNFNGQELVIFVWKGSDEDKFHGCYRERNWLEADFRYIPAGLPPRHQHDDLFVNKAGPEKPKPDQQLTQTAVFILAKHTQIRVRELSAPFGRVVVCNP